MGNKVTVSVVELEQISRAARTLGLADTDGVTISVDGSSGIGTTVIVTVKRTINGITGEFSVNVTDYNTW